MAGLFNGLTVMDYADLTGDEMFPIDTNLPSGASPQSGLLSVKRMLSKPAIGATITVGAESTNVRAITIQLTDASGDDLAYRGAVLLVLLLDANGDAFAVTGGSTGIAIGTDGALLALVAKKAFVAISEADGDIDLTWTDTGTEAAYLGVMTSSGRLIVSAALTNA